MSGRPGEGCLRLQPYFSSTARAPAGRGRSDAPGGVNASAWKSQGQRCKKFHRRAALQNRRVQWEGEQAIESTRRCYTSLRLRGEVGSHRRCDPGEDVQVSRLNCTGGESPSPQPSPRKSGARERTAALAYRLALACSAELCAASASFAEISAVAAGVPQLGASLPSPQARGR
jgi:hypothetical protein